MNERITEFLQCDCHSLFDLQSVGCLTKLISLKGLIIVRYKKIGYNVAVLRQTACLVANPIKVNSFAYLFNCTTVGRASD